MNDDDQTIPIPLLWCSVIFCFLFLSWFFLSIKKDLDIPYMYLDENGYCVFVEEGTCDDPPDCHYVTSLSKGTYSIGCD